MSSAAKSRMVWVVLVAITLLIAMPGCRDSRSHGYKSAHVTTLSETNFQAEILSSPSLAMVDFWAVWCGPCKALAPTVDAVADSYAGRLKVGAVDVDAVPSLPQRYAIEGMPTLLFFKNGRVVDRILGLVSERELRQKIDGLLAGAPGANGAGAPASGSNAK